MYKTRSGSDHCAGCVYYPPNLPANAYSEKDYRMLAEKCCAFDFQPMDEDCSSTRKTSCSLVDLEHLERSV